MKTQPVFWIFEKDGLVCFKVTGKGSFQNAPLLKKATQQALDEGRKHFAFDLSECTGMDSTFLGILSGLALKIKNLHGEMSLAGLDGRNLELVENMGLNRLVKLVKGDAFNVAHGSAPIENESATKAEINTVMLEAHKTLISIDERNLAKFRDVVEYLSESEKS